MQGLYGIFLALHASEYLRDETGFIALGSKLAIYNQGREAGFSSRLPASFEPCVGARVASPRCPILRAGKEIE